jgi:hypothetical protein
LPKPLIDRPVRVSVHGLPTFCEKLTQLVNGGQWHVPYRTPFTAAGLAARFNDLVWSDMVYSWGGRISFGQFTRVARILGKKKLIMLWCGSDVLFAKQEIESGVPIEPWIREKIHWAVSPVMEQEVRALGLDCEYVQASFVDPMPEPTPLPQHFRVLAYAPSMEKAALYGIDSIIEVARRLPDVDFSLVGVEDGPLPNCPPNIQAHGRVSLKPFYEQHTVIYRPTQHDGLSFMVIEGLAQGRHVLYSLPFPATTRVPTTDAAVQELARLRELHRAGELGLNQEGIDLIRRDFSADKVRRDLLSRWEKVILSPPGKVRTNAVQVTS